MTDESLDDATAAARLGLARSHVSKLRRGVVFPSVPLIFRIEHVSKGRVRWSDWRVPALNFYKITAHGGEDDAGRGRVPPQSKAECEVTA